MVNYSSIALKLRSSQKGWAYDSRVNGNAHEGSDLDLAVINPLLQLREALSDSNLPILVDVMDWARIPEAFQKEIKKNYMVVYP